MPEKTSYSFRSGILVFLGLFLLSLVLQWKSGAWESDFGGHADEGAHVVTSLMVRDYLAGGWKGTPHPMKYAESYYEQFPKVAIGHYPPGFYAVASIPLLLFRSPYALLLLMAILCALVAWMTWRLGSLLLQNRFSALALAILVCWLPLFRTYTAIVMADLLLVIFCLLAVEAFSRFLIGKRAGDSLLFGLWAAAAILTKASGIGLALVPPVAILLSRNWIILRDFRLWLAPVPVLLLAFPWMWLTRNITAEGMQEISMLSYARESLLYYTKGILAETGWFLGILAACAIAVFLSKRDSLNREREALVASLVALAISSLMLIVALPTGLDLRYLLLVLPAILLLGAWFWESRVCKGHPAFLRWSIPIICLVSACSMNRPVEKRYTGAGEAFESILSAVDSSSTGGKPGVLLITNARGEGALTAAAAFLGKDKIVVARGNKLLSESDWLGRGYEKNFETFPEFVTLLEKSRIDYLIVEAIPSQEVASEHWNWVTGQFQTREAIARILSGRKRGGESFFSIYGRPQKVEMDIPPISQPSESETEP